MNLSLEDKLALVGGSSKGIGKAAATALAELGASVCLLARNEAALRQVQESLPRPNGQEHYAIVADFRKPEAVQAAVIDFIHSNGPVHILVNNTGGPAGGKLLNEKPEKILDAYQMHLICNHLLVQAVVPGMEAAGYGRIIQVISTSVREPIPNLGVSNTTRGAVASWAKTLAGEVGPLGITVNNVLPGYTSTERLDEIIENVSKKSDQSREKVIETFKAKVPLRRFAAPSEVGNVIAFLASPAAGYISGQSLAVDGGRTNCI